MQVYDVSKLKIDLCIVRMICLFMDWRNEQMNYLNSNYWGIVEVFGGRDVGQPNVSKYTVFVSRTDCLFLR